MANCSPNGRYSICSIRCMWGLLPVFRNFLTAHMYIIIWHFCKLQQLSNPIVWSLNINTLQLYALQNIQQQNVILFLTLMDLILNMNFIFSYVYNMFQESATYDSCVRWIILLLFSRWFRFLPFQIFKIKCRAWILFLKFVWILYVHSFCHFKTINFFRECKVYNLINYKLT